MRRLLLTVPLLTVPLLLELVAVTVRLTLLVDSVRVTVALPLLTDPMVAVEVTRGSVRVVVVVTLVPELALPAPVRVLELMVAPVLVFPAPERVVVVVTVLPLGRVLPLVTVPLPGLVKPPLLVLPDVPVRVLSVRPVVTGVTFSNLPSNRLFPVL